VTPKGIRGTSLRRRVYPGGLRILGNRAGTVVVAIVVWVRRGTIVPKPRGCRDGWTMVVRTHST